MSLGSRTLKRGGRAIFRAACPASTPREPLPFLYPRLLHPRLHATASLQPIEEQQSSSVAPEKSNIPLEPEVNNDKPLKDVEIDEDLFPPTETHGKVHRILKKLSLKVTEREEKDEYEDTTRRLYRARRTKAEGIENYEADWRTILSSLVESTPRAAELPDERGIKVNGPDLPYELAKIDDPELPRKLCVRIEVPGTAINSLLYHPKNNIWSIQWQTGCKIQILHKISGAGETRTLSLYGPRENIPEVIREIQSIVSKNVTDTEAIDSFKLNTFEIPALPTILYGATGPPEHEPPQPSQIEKWTQKTFKRYVERLVKSGRQYTQRRVFQMHAAHVRNRLITLFEDPNLCDAISVDAFNMAIAYFMKTGQIKDVRRLFVGMETIGMKMQTETFNIMLRGAAKVHDLHNCGFLLGMMLKRGLQPDAGTWLAFLNTLTDFSVQVHVIAAMRHKGLLREIKATQSLCRELSSLEMKWSVVKKQSLHDFILHMDQRYGPHWLSVSSANRILHQLALHGLFSRCCTFVGFMESRLVQPNSVSLHTVISSCKHLRNFEGAMEALKIFQNLGVKLDTDIYQSLFYMALDRRLYSSARVLWRYACLSDATTSYMRKTITNASNLPIPSTPTTKGAIPRRRFWLQTAGKVILGHATTSVGHPAGYYRPAFHTKKLVKKPLIQPSKFSEYRPLPRIGKAPLKAWTRTQMNLDLLVHLDWYPTTNLYDVLEKAYHQDMEWNAQHIWFEKSLKWISDNAIGVEMTNKYEKDAEMGNPVTWAWE